MKKNSVIALMIFAILLTGCNRTGNLSDTPGGNSEYVENIMPSEFENCENEMLDINTYSLLNEPSEYAQSSCYSARISKGDMGYYHVIDHKLRVLDTKSQTLVTVCDKPNCRHEDSTCVANEMTSTSRVTMNIMDHAYYKGYVYFIGQNKDTEYVYLHRISGDGSVREECMPLFKFDSKAASYRWPSFVISHDILYYIDYEEKQPRIRKCGLDSKEQSVVFATENPDGLVYRMKIYGDFLFFQAGTIDDDEGDVQAGIYAYNMKTGETKLVLNNVIAGYAVVDTRIVYSFDGDIYAYDLRTADNARVIDTDFAGEGASGFVNNSEYIVLDNLEVYTLSGEYVCKLALEEFYDILGMDEDYIIAQGHVRISEMERRPILTLKPISELDEEPFEEYDYED